MNTLDEQLNEFIMKLPNTTNETLYIVLYNKDFQEDFIDRVIDLKSESLSKKIVFVDRKINLKEIDNLYIFAPTYDYIGNGYN